MGAHPRINSRQNPSQKAIPQSRQSSKNTGSTLLCILQRLPVRCRKFMAGGLPHCAGATFEPESLIRLTVTARGFLGSLVCDFILMRPQNKKLGACCVDESGRWAGILFAVAMWSLGAPAAEYSERPSLHSGAGGERARGLRALLRALCHGPPSGRRGRSRVGRNGFSAHRTALASRLRALRGRGSSLRGTAERACRVLFPCV